MAGNRVHDPGDWVPVPDPTVLTNAAVLAVKSDLRREIEASAILANERWSAHSEQHHEQLEALRAASEALRDRLEMAEESRRQLQQQDMVTNQRAIDELKRTVEKRFDGVDEWRTDTNDQLATYPTRAENRSALDAVTISIASLSDKLQTHITAMAAMTGNLVTKDQIESQERIRENDRRETRRAMVTAMTSAGIALVGWIITLILFLLTKHTPVP